MKDERRNPPQGSPTHAAHLTAQVTRGPYAKGVVIVEGERGLHEISAVDMDVVAGLTAPVSAAIGRLQAGEQYLERRRVLQDLVTARRIQRSFLPALDPVVEGFRVATEYRPAYDVGGDFYDVFASGSGRITAVIGDVSGKGVSAALVMARISSDIRRLAPKMASPRDLIEQLNAVFSPLSSEDVFVTAVCVTLDAVKRQITLCNAGHVLPIVRRVSGAAVSLGSAAGPPVGVFAGHRYDDEYFQLDVGDVVLMMTDGITEALHSSVDLLGRAALGELIRLAPPNGAEINRRILDTIEARGGVRKLDDIALLALDVTVEAVRPHFATAAREARSGAC